MMINLTKLFITEDIAIKQVTFVEIVFFFPLKYLFKIIFLPYFAFFRIYAGSGLCKYLKSPFGGQVILNQSFISLCLHSISMQIYKKPKPPIFLSNFMW